MSKLKTFLNIILLTLLLTNIGCDGDDKDKDEPTPSCDFAISYKVDGVLTTHIEEVVTSEIWSGSNYPVNRKVYDIWTEESPTFNFHTSMALQGEVSHHTSDWQNSLGSTLLLNAVGLESDNLTFIIEQEASSVGDLVKISFSGTTTSGHAITDGLICTKIDTVH